VAEDSDIADNLISGSLKRSLSYHQDYAKKTYGEIKNLAAADPPDSKARQMKKLIEQAERLRQSLRQKGKGRRK
jgi:hypothetical protein